MKIAAQNFSSKCSTVWPALALVAAALALTNASAQTQTAVAPAKNASAQTQAAVAPAKKASAPANDKVRPAKKLAPHKVSDADMKSTPRIGPGPTPPSVKETKREAATQAGQLQSGTKKADTPSEQK